MMNRSMRIGDLATRAEVTPRTIRYYERLGIIPTGERVGNGQHHYPESTVARLKKIEQLKRIGLTLEEIRDVIELYFTDLSGRRPKRRVLGLLRQHLEETDHQLRALKEFRSDLKRHIDRFERWLGKAAR